ncbi:hypothetical protein OQJ62_12195 [Microbulbifer thermotolerans]|uniref:hypothetical protein n=1 Tax=Microbulbifer thermotolerans TaxID=252514 RepID=UPI0022496853|nr:hypothetical protein [Microbulbifer thermotolerans]MCX2795683.1 hypothetical protein [Microbulbifer thermotolerans]
MIPDIYVFARGDGVDTINDSGSSAGDTLLFEGAIAPEDIWLVKNGNHLDIYLLAGAEKVQVRNWKSSESAIEVIATEADAELPLANIDALAELMTAIGVPQNGVISLSGDQQAQVAEARNTAWQ